MTWLWNVCVRIRSPVRSGWTKWKLVCLICVKNIALVHERKEHLNVRSQIDGELGLLDVVLGQNVSAGQKIGQINDLSDYKIEALIDEHYIDRVKKGLSATFERQGSDF